MIFPYNREKFIQPDFFPMSLFFLGLLSFKDEFSLGFPNLSVKLHFLEYYNELKNISVSSGYTDMCRAFLKDHDLGALFAGYWARYVGQIPAQAFDKINENFFRISFYEICTRYLNNYLNFAIEVNRPSGRSDFEALGRQGTAFEGKAWVLSSSTLAPKMPKDWAWPTGAVPARRYRAGAGLCQQRERPLARGPGALRCDLYDELAGFSVF